MAQPIYWPRGFLKHLTDQVMNDMSEDEMSSDNEIEKEIQAKGLTAPRVTLADIENVIAYEYYITGGEIHGNTVPVLGPMHRRLDHPHLGLRCLTLCVLMLKNGFTVTGESACASPENFDAELGRKRARQKAIDKVWMLEGYLLKEKLHASEAR
jgi:Phage protein (N4 Gp49/phage Sf6 gene 66) family